MQSEKRKELTKQIVIRLKEVIQDMSDAEVMQKMAEAGEQTSIATIRRIRAAGSEDSGFNYNLTVKPFARVFLELSSKPIDVESLTTEEEKDRATLDNTIQMKNLEIDGLQTELATSRRSIEFLKEQVAIKDKQLDDRKDFVLRLEKEKNALRRENNMKTLLIFVVLILALVFSATDSLWALF
ncbi:MAG: hypothetical protein E7420_08700 [Ruminococcaceae bacterium]|nr:hypothetical protein [Oscillospiraceae bacterium]